MKKFLVIPAKAGIYLNRFRVKPGMTAVIFIIIFGLWGAKALLHSGFYTSHDGEHQLVRQYIFEQGLKDRQIPVRFNRQLYNGFGYPLFFFTYRLPFYFGEVFRFIGLSYADSIKSVFFIAFIASGLAMFWFARRWGNLAGVISAILYMWAPYRFSVIFVRSALGEHMAAVLVPLLFASVIAGKKKNVNFILGAASLARFIFIACHDGSNDPVGVYPVGINVIASDRRKRGNLIKNDSKNISDVYFGDRIVGILLDSGCSFQGSNPKT